MAYYLTSGGYTTIVADEALTVHEKLPALVYTVVESPNAAPKLQVQPPLPLPEKQFGDIQTITKRVMTSFLDREEPTGVLLSGLKGSGKSVTARYIAMECVSNGIPCIVLKCGQLNPEIAQLIDSIQSQCMLLIDEIDKIKPEDTSESQRVLLSLLDGSGARARRLTVCTANSSGRLNNVLLSRPGRFRYHYKYTGVSKKVITEFIYDQMKHSASEERVSSVVQFFMGLRRVSFDILGAIVEEALRFPDMPVKDLASDMNIEQTRAGAFSMKAWYKPWNIEMVVAPNCHVYRESSSSIYSAYLTFLTLGHRGEMAINSTFTERLQELYLKFPAQWFSAFLKDLARILNGIHCALPEYCRSHTWSVTPSGNILERECDNPCYASHAEALRHRQSGIEKAVTDFVSDVSKMAPGSRSSRSCPAEIVDWDNIYSEPLWLLVRAMGVDPKLADILEGRTPIGETELEEHSHTLALPLSGMECDAFVKVAVCEDPALVTDSGDIVAESEYFKVILTPLEYDD